MSSTHISWHLEPRSHIAVVVGRDGAETSFGVELLFTGAVIRIAAVSRENLSFFIVSIVFSIENSWC